MLFGKGKYREGITNPHWAHVGLPSHIAQQRNIQRQDDDDDEDCLFLKNFNDPRERY